MAQTFLRIRMFSCASRTHAYNQPPGKLYCMLLCSFVSYWARRRSQRCFCRWRLVFCQLFILCMVRCSYYVPPATAAPHHPDKARASAHLAPESRSCGPHGAREPLLRAVSLPGEAKRHVLLVHRLCMILYRVIPCFSYGSRQGRNMPTIYRYMYICIPYRGLKKRIAQMKSVNQEETPMMPLFLCVCVCFAGCEGGAGVAPLLVEHAYMWLYLSDGFC